MKVPEQNNPAPQNDKRTETNSTDPNDPAVKKMSPEKEQQDDETEEDEEEIDGGL